MPYPDHAAAPIYLFTDFGHSGPYVGQVIAAIQRANPGSAVVDLMHDAPRMQPDLAAYLLPALVQHLPENAVVVAVVDPGVGGARRPLMVEAGGRWFVGPDNGLLARLADIERVVEVTWRPAAMSSTFHGRDLFAPIAAWLARGKAADGRPLRAAEMVGADWPDECHRVVYIDGYGNLMTGVPAQKIPKNKVLWISERRIAAASNFSEVPVGELFWYPNSQGLLEIAANQAPAARILSLALGDKILLD